MADNAKGALFVNTKKTQPNHPDYTGNFVLTRDLLTAYVQAMGNTNELKILIAGWKKTSQNTETYLGLSMNAPYQDRQDRLRDPPTQPSRGKNPFEDDIPFG